MSAPVRPGLLVSVRSAAEAEAALAGGADLIDVKEPSRGSLGRADDAVIEEVIRVVAGRRPVSVAMGDYPQSQQDCFPLLDSTYHKLGFHGWQSVSLLSWHAIRTILVRTGVTTWSIRPISSEHFVPVAYADWGRANAPEPAALCQFVRHYRSGVFALDTFTKDASTLLDWMPHRQIALLTHLCHNDGVRVALAGSLGLKEIAALAHVKPDWFAVRGAVCCGGKREGTVDEKKVRELKTLLV